MIPKPETSPQPTSAIQESRSDFGAPTDPLSETVRAMQAQLHSDADFFHKLFATCEDIKPADPHTRNLKLVVQALCKRFRDMAKTADEGIKPKVETAKPTAEAPAAPTA